MEPLFDKLSRKMMERHIPPSRFFASMAFTVAAVLILMSLSVPDTDSGLAAFQPEMAFEITARILLAIIAWPFLVAALQGIFPIGIASAPLLILTTLFWAFVIEGVFALKAHRRAKTKKVSN
jgi:uncharacterized membrane protein